MWTPHAFSLEVTSGFSTRSQVLSGMSPSRLANLLHVDADAGRAPHVVDGVLVAGVEHGEALLDLRPHVGEVRQLRLVELLEDLGADQPLQERPRRHHDVVARFAGKQLRLDDLVVVVGVVDDLDAGLLRELLEHLRIDIVRPVIDVDDALLRGSGGDEGQANSQRSKGGTDHQGWVSSEHRAWNGGS